MSGKKNHNPKQQLDFDTYQNDIHLDKIVNNISESPNIKTNKAVKSNFLDKKIAKLVSLKKSQEKNNSLTKPPIKSVFQQLKAQVASIVMGSILIVPILAVATGTYYLANEAINQQILARKGLENRDLTSKELTKQKRLLKALLVGRKVTGLLAAVIVALVTKRLIDAKFKSSRTTLEEEAEKEKEGNLDASLNLNPSEVQKELLQAIRQSLTQPDILQISVEEVRKVLKCDRVLVYSLNQDGYEIVIAESVAADYPKALNQIIPDPCFEARYIEKYREGRVQALNDIYAANLSSCYLEQLASLEVKANLVTPILNQEKIFGLLIAHQCSSTREWQDSEIRWMTQIATEVGLALDYAQMLGQAKNQQALAAKEREWTNYLTDAVQTIHQSLSQPDILQISVEEVRKVLKCDRVLVYSLNQDGYEIVIAESVAADYPKALNQIIPDPCFEARYIEKYREGRVQALNDIYAANLSSCYLEQLASLEVKANLVTPILNQEKIFGLLIAHQCSSTREWQDYEIRWMTQIATQVGLALDHAKLFKELNDKSLSHRLLNNSTFDIGDCLTETELLKSIVEQVFQGMELERTIICKFDGDGNGTVVAESVVSDYPRALNSQFQDTCLAQENIKKYPQGHVKSFPNVYQANLTECHLKQLEFFAVKSSLIAPIWQNEQLFGLLIGHQCSQPRSWETSEIELFAQLALQSGLALRKLKLQQELFLKQDIYPNESEKQPLKANNLSEKISELNKISQIILENQNTWQQLKLKTSYKSTSNDSLINQVEDINQEL